MAAAKQPRSARAAGLSLAELWMFLGVALPTLAALLVPMPSVDLAYQLRAGAGILAGHGIPATDTWTFTIAGAPWLDQQWGAQVLLAAVYQAAGWTGLALLRAALVGATFWLVMATLRSMGCAARPAALLALGGFVVAAPALALRPQLFTIVLFAAALAILADRARHPRRLLLLPLMAVAWANLHGSFPLIVVVLGLGWADEIGRVLVARAAIRPGHGPGRASAAIRGSTGLALLAAISALATLATPFGIDAWRYVEHLAADPSVTSAVSEWRPPSPTDPTGAIFYISLLIAVVIVVLRVRADRNRVVPATFAPIATLLVFGVLGVVTARGLAWWALVLPISASALTHDGSLARFLPRRLGVLRTLFTGPSVQSLARQNRPSQLNTIVALLLILVGIGLLPAWRPIGPAGVPTGVLSYAPQGIAAKLDAYARARMPIGLVRIWVPQSWGSWIEFAAPDALVSVDSRIELYPPDIWISIGTVAAGGLRSTTTLSSYHANVVVVPAGQDFSGSSAWAMIYQDADGSIWATGP
ncbi:MAG TPA: hypothetical protein VE011_02060 [Candidatus Dormibacteraeota bacterium]|nr:hypothetical protein [Candidatus Dormibacteraeota bacterium]